MVNTGAKRMERAEPLNGGRGSDGHKHQGGWMVSAQPWEFDRWRMTKPTERDTLQAARDNRQSKFPSLAFRREYSAIRNIT